jgi:clan AA aspartic protease
MGLTYVEEVVAGPSGKSAPVRFLVDSGATYTLLPHAVCQELGLRPKRSHTFVLADGTRVERNISECHITLEQGDGHTPVIMGEEGDEALLGAVTLEILGLILNPFTRSLHPMRMMLA